MDPAYHTHQSKKKIKSTTPNFDEESELSSVGANSESSSENNGSSSSSSEVEGGKQVTADPKIDPEYEEGDLIRSKDPEVQESIRWKVKDSKKHFCDGLQSNQSRNMKRPIAEEHQIVTTGLHEYPDLERRFNEYELGCL